MPPRAEASADAHLVETRISGRTLVKGGFLELRRDEVRLPDGSAATREYIQHPGAVAIVPVLDDGRLARVVARNAARSVRRFADRPVDPALIEESVAEALTAPAPHHTRPVRFVWLRDAQRRIALLDRMKDAWRDDLTGDGLAADAVSRRLAKGQILYDAPEVVIPVMVPDGAHSYPDAQRTAAEHTMFTVAVGAAVQGLLVSLAVRGVGSCWIGSTIFAADLVRQVLDLPQDWEPLGAIAIGHHPDDADPPGPRNPVVTEGLLVTR